MERNIEAIQTVGLVKERVTGNYGESIAKIIKVLCIEMYDEDTLMLLRQLQTAVKNNEDVNTGVQ